MKKISLILALAVFTLSKAQTFTLSSPQNYTLGCGTKTVCTININPPPLTYTLMGPPLAASVTATTSVQGSPTMSIPGTWTIAISYGSAAILVPVSILQNTFAPDASVTVQTQTLSCFTPSTVLKAESLTPNVSYSWFSLGSGSVTTATVSVNNILSSPAISLLTTYTLVITNPDNACTNQTVIPIYQNINTPTLMVTEQFSCPDPPINLYATILSFGQILSYTWTVPQNATLTGVYNPTLTTNLPGTYTLTVMDGSSGCISNTQIQVEGCVDLLEYKKSNSELRIYPNPTKDLVNIKGLQVTQSASIKVYNVIGVLVKSQLIYANDPSVDIGGEPRGIYYIELFEGNTSVFLTKIIKQ